MSNLAPPADQPLREQALDPGRSILVQAPAGSGKTTLLTERFLRLLAEVDDPGQVVAITFTNAAAAEMRNRILDELRNPLPSASASRVLLRSQALGWKLLELPAQLRISTIDSFCRDLALQQPLLSGLGGGLQIAEQPTELYRRAARQTLEQIGSTDPALSAAIEALLLWRDNNWQEMEDLLVEMLSVRDRWMHDFVLGRELDEQALRERLERPFAGTVREALTRLGLLLSQLPDAREEALLLARFACEEPGKNSPWQLAESVEIPGAPFTGDLEEAREVFTALANFLQTQKGAWRTEKGLKAPDGFPATPRGRAGKARFAQYVAALSAIPGLEAALAAVRNLPPARYPQDVWQIVHACFTLLRRAAAELHVAFAEAGAVDFIEVAQAAQHVLKDFDGLPTDAALAVSDGIRHLLVDEAQDTSRRQHQLLAGLIAAWPERTGRTCFAVGDPMQSIYSFRDADPELFWRLRSMGLELPNDEPLVFDFVPLQANFRTEPDLVARLNQLFQQIFAADDGSGVIFSSAQPARGLKPTPDPRFALHLAFVPQAGRGRAANPETAREREDARAAQTAEMVELICDHLAPMAAARARGERYRVAVLGRTRNALVPVALALREAAIPFRAVELEKLSARPEVLDALALARALLNPLDRVAWLGLLRAPWCGLTLDDLHRLASADDPELLTLPVPELLAQRLALLSQEGCVSATRVLDALASVPSIRASQPTASLGTWLEQVWLRLGGAACVDAAARANLDLLWSCLDHLPSGEQNLLGPALEAALDKLTALPDPAASSDCGVQLMTIHKSKGLEFEVVLVPDLQAGSGQSGRKLLAWLERGLDAPDDSGEITEFLIAPLQSKGADRGSAKAWVDWVHRQRETQESRRILYVAATRAREQLHLFARPAYKAEGDSLSLVEPSNSLLATAWPALEEEVRARFQDWKTARAASDLPQEQEIESIAASGESNLLVMPSPVRPTLLRRLPPDYAQAQAPADSPEILRAPSFPRSFAERVGSHEPQPATGLSSAGAPGLVFETSEKILRAPSFPRSFAERVGSHEPQLTSTLSSQGAPGLVSETWENIPYSRHQGGLLSRALGTAVHKLLQDLTQLRLTQDWQPARTALSRLQPRIAAQLRAVGIDPAQAARIAADALELALNASRSPHGEWILSPRAQAASEVGWTGVVAGNLRTIRVDRLFRAGHAPLSEGEDYWWIVDYKTAHADNANPASVLPELRKLFAPQLETYAAVLRNLHGADAPIRAALFYPRMLQLDWWEL